MQSHAYLCISHHARWLLENQRKSISSSRPFLVFHTKPLKTWWPFLLEVIGPASPVIRSKWTIMSLLCPHDTYVRSKLLISPVKIPKPRHSTLRPSRQQDLLNSMCGLHCWLPQKQVSSESWHGSLKGDLSYSLMLNSFISFNIS